MRILARTLGAAALSGVAMCAAMGMPVTTAQAADIVEPFVPAPVVPPVVVLTWSGAYLGGFVAGHLGGDLEFCRDRDGDDDDLFDDDDNDKGRCVEADDDLEGITGGVIAGWNWQPGRSLVFGIEGDVGFGQIDTDRRRRRVFDVDGEEIVLRERDEFEIDLLSHVRGRIGWAGWHPNVLLFAAGGLSIAEGNLESRREFNNDDFFDDHGDDDQTFFGWTVGGGIDWKITPHLVVRAEYLFDR